MDQPRRAPRYFFSAPAEILVERSGAKIDARVNEISLYGCYLDASIPLSVKTAVLLKILGRADYFEADATVIYANPTAGMGCLAPEFLDSELSVFMQRLRAQGAAGEPGRA